MAAARVVASYKNWTVSIADIEESSIAQLSSGGKIIASAEGAYSVLVDCPVDVADKLRQQLIDDEIAQAGGIEKYKELVYKNQLKYGVQCYNYLDVDTLKAFAVMGIYLSNRL
jgi:hypothetical protein